MMYFVPFSSDRNWPWRPPMLNEPIRSMQTPLPFFLSLSLLLTHSYAFSNKRFQFVSVAVQRGPPMDFIFRRHAVNALINQRHATAKIRSSRCSALFPTKQSKSQDPRASSLNSDLDSVAKSPQQNIIKILRPSHESLLTPLKNLIFQFIFMPHHRKLQPEKDFFEFTQFLQVWLIFKNIWFIQENYSIDKKIFWFI